MRPDDLTNLLKPAPPADVGWRQGLIESWDPVSGTNAVNVGGTVLTNLPTLAANEAAVFRAGDAVGLLRVRSQYFVLGRIVPPGSTSPVQVAGTLGMGDAAFTKWPSTGSTTDTELLVGFVQRLGGRLSFSVRTYVGVNTSGVFRVTINGTEVANSGTFTGGAAGAIGTFQAVVDFPAGIAYLDEPPVAITGRVTAGTNEVAATLRLLQMA